MSERERLVLILSVYGNLRHKMPVHQAAEVAEKAIDATGTDVGAIDLLQAFDEAFKRFIQGGYPD